MGDETSLNQAAHSDSDNVASSSGPSLRAERLSFHQSSTCVWELVPAQGSLCRDGKRRPPAPRPPCPPSRISECFMPSFQMGSLASGDSSEAWLRRVGLSPAHFGPRLVSAFRPSSSPPSTVCVCRENIPSVEILLPILSTLRWAPGRDGTDIAACEVRLSSDLTASVYPCVKWNEQSRRPSGVLEEAAGFCMWSWGVGAALTVLWPGRLGRPTSASPVLRPEVPDQAAGGSSVGGGAPGSQTRLLAVCPRGREMRGSF